MVKGKKINKYQAVRNYLKKLEAIDPNIVGLYYLDSKNDKQSVKLLEVNSGTIACGIQLLGFDPTPEFPYKLIIGAVTPDEFEKIKKREILLPEDYKLNYVFKGEKLNKNERGLNKRMIMLENANINRAKKKQLAGEELTKKERERLIKAKELER